MANPDILFRGIPRTPTRSFTAEIVRAARPSRVVVPCCGSFSLAYTAVVAGGVPAGRVICSDVSLYSHALGQAILGQDWRLELKDELAEPVRPFLADPVTKAAAVLLVIRALQYQRKAKHTYHHDRARELLENAQAYVEELKGQVAELACNLRGITYRPRDLWEEAEEYRGDPETLFLFNPPRYTGGYERMFAGVDEVFDWDRPGVRQFEEKDYPALVGLLGEGPAATLLYYASQGEDPAEAWGPPWKSVFADRPGTKHVAVNWIVSNRPADLLGMTRSRLGVEPERKYPLFAGEVTAESNIWAVRVARPVGEYYKDLFIHRLPGSLSEVYVAVLLDGYLLGIVGVHLYNLRTMGPKQPANVTFAFSTPHEGYARLHKLLLLSILSSWLWDDVLGQEDWYSAAGPPRRVQSTMLTPHPENKTARGTGRKLGNREEQPDGSFKLSYYGDIVDRTRAETVALWLRKFGK